MPSQIGKLKYLFVILLGVLSISVVGYSLLYGIPSRKCEGSGGWFSWKDRQCYAPIAISQITGRKNGEPAKIDFHDDALKASNARAVNGAAKDAASHQAASGATATPK
ncbi:hypothetical protein AEAC466_01755 [Asticcacaulis sp. AC466]|uniref:hypothetical protein n=1 Tax=Asticcacaulis sp. AC466 TaxID=1282362 RepID=UPI0003C3F365|nr:hypothetical protein [Asticcacaulis sp. AC466]ESQ85931.1 hypothetical protein AEAC466_01755 [Asticcacaulis sp. AC466]